MVHAELGQVLLDEASVRNRVRELGASIGEDHTGRDLLLIGVLKGAALFTADLARSIRLPLQMDWVSVSTYGRGSRAGQRRVLKHVEEDVVRGQHVLVVEDILDSGATLSWLLNELQHRGAASVASCVLLCKPNVTGHLVRPAYVGFETSAHWVAGYGIDYAEQWRNRSDINEVLLPALADV